MTALVERPSARWAFFACVVAAPRRRGCARGPAARQGEAAAVRQQERVPGDDRPSRGDAARGDPRDGAADEGLSGHGPRGARRPALRRQHRALQLQRPRPPLLPAALPAAGRPAGEPRRRSTTAMPRATTSRSACAPPSWRSREGARAQREGGRDPARAAGASTRWWRRSTVRPRRSGRRLARRVRGFFETTAGVVDVRRLDGGASASACS